MVVTTYNFRYLFRNVYWDWQRMLYLIERKRALAVRCRLPALTKGVVSHSPDFSVLLETQQVALAASNHFEWGHVLNDNRLVKE